jgi:hypothetical protein
MEIYLNSVQNAQNIGKSSITSEQYQDLIAIAHRVIPQLETASKTLIANKPVLAQFDADGTAKYGRPSSILVQGRRSWCSRKSICGLEDSRLEPVSCKLLRHGPKDTSLIPSTLFSPTCGLRQLHSRPGVLRFFLKY